MKPTPHPLETELATIVERHIANQPRTLQTSIGPSEIGHPCQRRVAHKTAGTPPSNPRGAAWKPFVGVAMHHEFEMILELDALRRYGGGRWVTEQKLSTGQLNGETVTGSCDLFDTHTGTVVDWKFTTRNKILTQYRREGIGEQYRVQAHDYGRGWAARGHQVNEVAVFLWTRDGETTDRLWWSEPFQPDIAEAAYTLAERNAELVTALGPAEGMRLIPTTDAYCAWCPFWSPGATDLGAACPGHPGSTANEPPKTLTDALGTRK